MRRFSIISPLAPNGVGFLLNILLELNIMVFRGTKPNQGPTDQGPPTMWRRVGRKYYIKDEFQYENIKMHISSIRNNFGYVFEPDVEVHWDHPISLNDYQERSLIVFVRDPRDALFSLYRREKTAERISGDLDFKGFLNSRSARFLGIYNDIANRHESGESLIFRNYWYSNQSRFLGNGGYGTIVDEHLGYYETMLSGLANLGKERFMLVRYEDMKRLPLVHLINILGYLSVHRDISEMVHAINSSSVSKAAKIEMESRLTKNGNVINAKGMPYEWKSNLEFQSEYEAIKKSLDDLIRLLGYE